MQDFSNVSASQAALLGNYVYVFYDKDSNEPFYIGRGQGSRFLSHVKKSHNPAVVERIAEGNYDVDILVYGLDEETAKKVEAAAIDLVGIDNLLNATRGAGARQYGRVDARTLLRSIEEKPLTEIHHNMIVVSINNTYDKYGDDEMALYESTRGVWARIRPEIANQAELVVGVVAGRIAYVMTVEGWFPAGSTNYFLRPMDEVYAPEDRIEFVGRTADEDIQELYLGRQLQAGQGATYYGPFNNKVHLVDGQWQGASGEQPLEEL